MKVFISHDSRDKKRFVKVFANKLMENGIDVWYDDWELEYGDSLMKIFEDEVKCDIFISVISKYSIESNWVKEESDLAFIRKIEKQVKFIPLIIMEDEVKIPAQFNHMRQCRIKDIKNYDEEFKSLVGEIHGIKNKPPIGDSPKYVLETPIKGFELIDSIIIKSMGDNIIKNKTVFYDFQEIIELVKEFDFSKEDIKETIEVLKDENIISYTKVFGPHYFINIKLTPFGVIIYGENYMLNFNIIIKDISSRILNMEQMANQDNFKDVNAPNYIITSIIEFFYKLGYFKLDKFSDGSFIIYMLNGNGKRKLREFLD